MNLNTNLKIIFSGLTNSSFSINKYDLIRYRKIPKNCINDKDITICGNLKFSFPIYKILKDETLSKIFGNDGTGIFKKSNKRFVEDNGFLNIFILTNKNIKIAKNKNGYKVNYDNKSIELLKQVREFYIVYTQYKKYINDERYPLYLFLNNYNDYQRSKLIKSFNIFLNEKTLETAVKYCFLKKQYDIDNNDFNKHDLNEFNFFNNYILHKSSANLNYILNNKNYDLLSFNTNNRFYNIPVNVMLKILNINKKWIIDKFDKKSIIYSNEPLRV